MFCHISPSSHRQGHGQGGQSGPGDAERNQEEVDAGGDPEQLPEICPVPFSATVPVPKMVPKSMDEQRNMNSFSALNLVPTAKVS